MTKYFTIVTHYAHSGEVKGYSHHDGAHALSLLNDYRESVNTNDILVITDKFYAGDDVDMSIFEKSGE